MSRIIQMDFYTCLMPYKINFPTRNFTSSAVYLKADLNSCLKIIQEYADFIELTQAANPRAASVSELKSILYNLDISERSYSIHESPAEGIRSALEGASLGGKILVICGTFFIMSQARNILGLYEPLDPFPLELQETLNLNFKI